MNPRVGNNITSFRLSGLWGKKTEPFSELKEIYFPMQIKGKTMNWSTQEFALVLQNPCHILGNRMLDNEKTNYLRELQKKYGANYLRELQKKYDDGIRKREEKGLQQQRELTTLVENVWSQPEGNEQIRFEDDRNGTIFANEMFYLTITQRFIMIVNQIENQELKSKFKIMLFQKQNSYYLCFHFSKFLLASYFFGRNQSEKKKNIPIKEIISAARLPWVTDETRSQSLFGKLIHLVQQNDLLYLVEFKTYHFMKENLSLYLEVGEANNPLYYKEISTISSQLFFPNFEPDKENQTPRNELLSNRTGTIDSIDTVTNMTENNSPNPSIFGIPSCDSDLTGDSSFQTPRRLNMNNSEQLQKGFNLEQATQSLIFAKEHLENKSTPKQSRSKSGSSTPTNSFSTIELDDKATKISRIATEPVGTTILNTKNKQNSIIVNKVIKNDRPLQQMKPNSAGEINNFANSVIDETSLSLRLKSKSANSSYEASTVPEQIIMPKNKRSPDREIENDSIEVKQNRQHKKYSSFAGFKKFLNLFDRE